MSLTNLIETHSRRAASVCVLPCSTSRTARSRNSTGCGLPIPDPHICLKDTESQNEPHGNPESDQGRHALAVDIFESATALEQVQTQLETLYTITARTARLNLTN